MVHLAMSTLVTTGEQFRGSFCRASIKSTGFVAQQQQYLAKQAGLGPLVCSPWVNHPQAPKKVPVGECGHVLLLPILTLQHLLPKGISLGSPADYAFQLNIAALGIGDC